MDSAGLTYYEVILDSSNATYPQDSGYTKLDFPFFEIAGKLALNNIAYAKVLEVMIPFSYYTVNTLNNALQLIDSSGSFPLVISPGTYSPPSMVTELQTVLNNSASTFTYTVLYNSADLSFSIYNNSAVTAPFSVTFSIALDTLGFVLGFGSGIQASQTFDGAAGGNRLKGSVSSLLGHSYIFLNSQAIGNDTDLFLPRGSVRFGNGGPQLATIPRLTQESGGSDIHWIDPCPQKWFDLQNLDSLTGMDLFITDPNGNILTFNGKSFMVKLGVLLADTSQLRASHMSAKKIKVTGSNKRQ